MSAFSKPRTLSAKCAARLQTPPRTPFADPDKENAARQKVAEYLLQWFPAEIEDWCSECGDRDYAVDIWRRCKVARGAVS